MGELTAAKARLLMPVNQLAAWVSEVEPLIERAAKKNLASIRVPFHITKTWPCDSVTVPRLDVSPGKDFAEHFRQAGFVVKDHYEDRQFVDAAIVISWEGGSEEGDKGDG